MLNPGAWAPSPPAGRSGAAPATWLPRGIRRFGAALGLVVAAVSPAARATLGGAPGGWGGVAVAAAPAPGTPAPRRAAVRPGPHYTVHQVVAGDGSTWREYANRAGVVFAVTWSTRAKPDFASLLGRHHATYLAAARAEVARRPGIRRDATLHGPDLVVRTSGRLPAFLGRAWVPSLVPEAVDAARLR